MTVSRRVGFLDALRFIAAAAVLFQHVVEKQGSLGSEVVAILSPGVFGVVLFFIVSGFVMPLAAESNFDFATFIVRRLFRIYPLVLVVFALVALISSTGLFPAFFYISAASAKDWIANLLLVQDYVGATPIWGVTWTLSIEILWYVLFASSLTLFGPRFDDRLAPTAGAVMTGLALLSLVIDHRLPLGRIGMVYAAIFGCRIYRCYSGRISARTLGVDAALFIAVMALCNAISFGYFQHPNITMNQALIPWLLAPLLFLLVSTVQPVRESALVANKWVQYFGTVSFSTYLLHPLAIGICSLLDPSWLAVLASIVATYAFSAFGYAFVEVPGQRMGKKFIAFALRQRAISKLELS